MPVQLELPLVWIDGFDVDNTNGTEVTVVKGHVELPPDTAIPANVRRHGTTKVTLPHTRMNGRPGRLSLKVPRFRNITSGVTAALIPPIQDPRHAITWALSLEVRRRAGRDSAPAIAEDLGLSEPLVRTIIDEFVREYNVLFHPKAPVYLGLDEAHLAGYNRSTLVDASTGEAIEILHGQSEQRVTRTLLQLENRNAVEAVATDMYAPYIRAAAAAFPNATHVIDLRHVTEVPRQAMESCRKITRAGLTRRAQAKLSRNDRALVNSRRGDLSFFRRLELDTLLAQFEELHTAYWLKEEFYNIYLCTDRAAAEKAYRTWRAKALASGQEAFEEAVWTIDRWHDLIFNYFDVTPRITNAKTEALNKLFKEQHRKGNGYNGNFRKFRTLALIRHGQFSFQDYLRAYEQYVAHHGVTPLGDPVRSADPVTDLLNRMGINKVAA